MAVKLLDAFQDVRKAQLESMAACKDLQMSCQLFRMLDCNALPALKDYAPALQIACCWLVASGPMTMCQQHK